MEVDGDSNPRPQKRNQLTLVLCLLGVTGLVASFEAGSSLLLPMEVFLRLPARLRLTRLAGVFEPELETELETELEVEEVGRSNRLMRSFWVAETRRTTGRIPVVVESGISGLTSQVSTYILFERYFA